MDKRAYYPRVTKVLSVMHKEFLKHWVAREERRGLIDAIEEEGVDAAVKRFKEKPFCTNDFCSCESMSNLASAGESGTEFHTAIEAHIDGKTPDPGAAKFAFRRFLKWWEKQKVEVIKKEFKVYSDIWQFRGTADVLLRFGGCGLTVGDWKSSGSLSPTYYLQVAMYAGAAVEMGLFTWEDLDEEKAAGIFRFDKREKPYKASDIEFISRKRLLRYWDVACSLRRPFDFAIENKMLEMGR